MAFAKLILFLLVLVVIAPSAPARIRIGFLADSQNHAVHSAAKLAAKEVDIDIVTLEVQDEGVSVVQEICSAMQGEGIHGLVGAIDDEIARVLVPAATERWKMPLVLAGSTPDGVLRREHSSSNSSAETFFRIGRCREDEIQVLLHVMTHMRNTRERRGREPYLEFPTERIGLLYSNDVYGRDGSSLLIEVIQRLNRSETDLANFDVVASLPFEPGQARPDSQLRQMKEAGVRIIVVWADFRAGQAVGLFETAGGYQMVGTEHFWYLSGRASTRDMFGVLPKDTAAGLAVGALGIQPDIPKDERDESFINRWGALDQKEYPGAGDGGRSIHPDVLFVYDGVRVLAEAIRKVANESGFEALPPYINEECIWGEPYEHGPDVAHALAGSSSRGPSGNVSFSKKSPGYKRSVESSGFVVTNLHRDFDREAAWERLWEYHFNGVNKTWDASEKLTDQVFPGKGLQGVYPADRQSTRRRELKVVAKPYSPFVFLDRRLNGTMDDNSTYPASRDEVRGLAVELLDRIAQQLDFTYKLFISNAKTNAVIQMVQEQQYDLAIGAITVTSARDQRLAFTTPYYDTGLLFLVRNASDSSGTWKFLTPFALSLWIVILLATIAYAFFDWIFEHDPAGPPGETYLPTVRNLRESGARVLLSLYDSLMTFMNSRERDFPRYLEGRILLVVYIIFAQIVILTYTAELAAFLSREKVVSQVDLSVEMLREGEWKNAIIIDGGSTQEVIERQVIECWPDCKKQRRVYRTCETVDDCIDQVNAGNASFFVTDAALLQYATRNDKCDNIVTGREFFPQGYAFVMSKKNVGYRLKELNVAILHAREDGSISRLRENHYGADHCAARREDRSRNPHTTTFGELAGLFYITLGVFGVTFFIWLMRTFGVKVCISLGRTSVRKLRSLFGRVFDIKLWHRRSEQITA